MEGDVCRRTRDAKVVGEWEGRIVDVLIQVRRGDLLLSQEGTETPLLGVDMVVASYPPYEVLLEQ